jgi:hypothetical protein
MQDEENGSREKDRRLPKIPHEFHEGARMSRLLKRLDNRPMTSVLIAAVRAHRRRVRGRAA